VTGTNGKTTVARLINHTLTLSGKTVGLTCTSGTYVGGKLVCRGDNSGPRSARAILSNKTIDAAVLETARGGIVREGLGYDLADIGVITNISEDHLGIDGVNTLEDLVFVKTLVAEAVKKNGFAVLNADDKATPEVLKRVKSKAILFHKDAQTEKIYESPDFVHVYTANGWLRIRDGVSQTDVIRVDMIPITCGGRIECNIENALAATAALYGLGTGISDIAEGLKSFNDNSGRFSVYELNGVRVMLDYGHNPTGFVQVIKTLGKFEYNRLIGVIGMPGDRTDSLIKEGARICAGAFDSIILKEDFDLRGRKDGEVARLMRDSITESGYDISRLKTELDEAKALELALSEAEKGDLIVVFYEKLEPLQQYLISLGAKTGALQPNSYVFGSVKEGLVWQGR
ncbi:MAG: Mur ligase family protein, partial [Bacillota bacterium]|nr:Mur ligase family protein [Bacillota bacterium]